MITQSNNEKEVGRNAMRIGMSITELPIMALLGYLVGASIDREIEGAIIGVTIGLILLFVSIRPALKSKKRGLFPNSQFIFSVSSFCN